MKQFSRKSRETYKYQSGFWKVLARAQWMMAWLWATAWESGGHTQSPPPGTGNVKHHKTSGHDHPQPQQPWLGLQKTQKLRRVILLSSSSGRKWETWSKRSVTKAGCRVHLKHWGCCTQTKEQHWTTLGFSPLLFSLHLCRLHQHRPSGFQKNYTKNSILHMRNCKLQTNSVKSKRNIDMKITFR